MNCSQVRAQLATYRELNKDLTDIPELKEHLAQCAACQEVYAQYQVIGEQIRSMPQIQPSPDAHRKLMQALAAEHVLYLQHSSASSPSAATPTPAFLSPYLNDVAKHMPTAESLAAFSRADTGPLPIVQATRSRRSRRMNHYAILGVAASFLMVAMMGGLMSLLFLANQGKSAPPIAAVNPVSVDRVNVAQANLNTYQTRADYPHIASASESNGIIYYSAYNTDKTSWTLEKFNSSNSGTNNQSSTPLLPTNSAYPIIVLGSDQNWLFWLQMEAPKKTGNKKSRPSQTQQPQQNTATKQLEGAWSLKALYLGTVPTASTTQTDTTKASSSNKKQSVNNMRVANNNIMDNSMSQPQTLLTDTFNQTTAPSWVNSPIQGISFYNNHVLISSIDSKGVSHLQQYQFDQNSISKTAELASTKDGHVLTSPTATSDGKNIYWAEEWLSQDNGLSSNIWTEQTINAKPEQTGRWAPHTQSEQYLYRADANSFHPQIVNDTLFWINKTAGEKIEQQSANVSTGNNTTRQSATSATPTAKPGPQTKSATGTSSTTATPVASATAANQSRSNMPGNLTSTDPNVLMPQIDESVTGTLVAYNAIGATPVSTAITNTPIVSNIEGGATYLVLLTKDGNLEMYDVVNKIMVEGISNIHNSAFITTDGNTVVSANYTDPSNDSANQTSTQVIFNLLNWPK